MYRYVETATRSHRVVVDGSSVFKVPLCNLSDRALLNMTDTPSTKPHCPHCWIGWMQPTDEEAVEHAGCAEAAPEPPPGAKPISILTPTRRLAVAALAMAALLGTAIGVVASSDMEQAADFDPAADRLNDLNDRFNDLLLRIEVLQADLHDHETSDDAHGTAAPQVIVIPGFPTSPPTSAPTPTPRPASTSGTGRSGSNDTNDTHTTTIIVVPAPTQRPGSDDPTPRPTSPPTPQPTVAPTPQPTPTPCFRPGEAKGAGDPCRWPKN